MKKTLIVTLLFIIATYFYVAFFVGLERKNTWVPYIDTQMAPSFTPEKWTAVKTGMTRQQVHALLGEPLSESTIAKSSMRPANCSLEENYSKDGKWKWADFAWCSFDIYYDSNLVVIKKDSRWWED